LSSFNLFKNLFEKFGTMEETTLDKKKKKKKEKKTKLLLGCIHVPSSNEESFFEQNAETKSEKDEKKEAKKRKKLAKIAERNEKKERKKRKKVDKKLGIDVEGAATGIEETAAASIEKKKKKRKDSEEGKDKKKKKKDKKKQKVSHGDVAGDADDVSVVKRKISPIGDDSVVVVELSLDEDGAAELGGKKRKLEGIVPKRKKKKRKIEESAALELPTAEETVKRKKSKKEKKQSMKMKLAELAESVPHVPTIIVSSHVNDDSIDSKHVSTLMSPVSAAAGGAGLPSIQERNDADSSDTNTPSAALTSSTNDAIPANPDPPVRTKKKKKKSKSDSEGSAPNDINTPTPNDINTPILDDVNTPTPNDVDTPTKAMKNELISELKEKVKKKKRKSDPVPEEKIATPVEVTTTPKDHVFSTPTKTPTSTAKPSLGQWGNTQLGSTEKTQKFFRLLGGMKKPGGSPLSFRSSKGSASSVEGGEEPEKAIMAMGRKDADALNNKLEEQFKKALGGIGKGKVGLGFSPQLDPASKKFHIDVNQSKSVKF